MTDHQFDQSSQIREHDLIRRSAASGALAGAAYNGAEGAAIGAAFGAAAAVHATSAAWDEYYNPRPVTVDGFWRALWRKMWL